jgi:PTS system fructose-specific IIA component/PTS system nitrogen regulatory IIA component
MTNDTEQRREGSVDHRSALDCGYPPIQTTTSRGRNCARCGGLTCLTEAISAGELPFLLPQAIVPDLTATTKEGAIREILGRLAASGVIGAYELESTIEAILKREELGSTAIGHGVAIPHICHPAIRQEVGTVARSRQGIEFDSCDGRPVHLIFLLLSPPDKPADHVRALGAVAKHLRSRGIAA